jgi:hypothetical protein
MSDFERGFRAFMYYLVILYLFSYQQLYQTFVDYDIRFYLHELLKVK